MTNGRSARGRRAVELEAVPTRYQSAVERLLTLADFERKSRAGEPPDFHLRRMETLLALMGDPHLATPTVHVAGTKGKGSTCAMVASVLTGHGVRTGLYTSPHLHTFRERIQVDRRPIDEADFAGLVDDLWPHIERVAGMGDRGTVTVFELLTAMAFEHFRRLGCGFQVIEVGLGGRLDATNLVNPAVAVITPVSLDHVAVLGDTVPKIAAEKAGIIKTEAPAVTGRQTPEAMDVIMARAAETGSPLVDAMRATELTRGPELAGTRQRFTVATNLARYATDLPLLGMHQADNARTAIATVEVLAGRRAALTLRTEAVERGLSDTVWPARFQVLNDRGPALVVDGAHNGDSGEALRATVEQVFPRRGKLIVIYGATRGHDAVGAARCLAPLKPVMIATRTRHPKAVDPVELAIALRGLDLEVAAIAPDTAAACQAARSMAEPDDLILGTGSLFVAAEVIETVRGIEPELYPTLKGDMMPTITASGV
jgi:dihydrofolate synthase/folylpolyglutamate synthase